MWNYALVARSLEPLHLSLFAIENGWIFQRYFKFSFILDTSARKYD